jgi:hypothetical protein
VTSSEFRQTMSTPSVIPIPIISIAKIGGKPRRAITEKQPVMVAWIWGEVTGSQMREGPYGSYLVIRARRCLRFEAPASASNHTEKGNIGKNNKLIPNDREQAALADMARMRAEGASLRDIAEAVKGRGLSISHQSVKRALHRGAAGGAA